MLVFILFVLMFLGKLLDVDPDTQTLLNIIKYALGPAAGMVVFTAVGWFIGQLTDAGHQPSPFAARWITYGTTVLVPSALYLLYVWLSGDPFNVATWILAVLSAFGISQFAHGQADLPRVPVKVVPLTPAEVAAKAKEK